MKERPIIFSAPMVRALLAGTKTQTRRIVKARDLEWMDVHQGLREPDNAERCPYGQPGDRLWVKETWRTADTLDALSPSAIAEKCMDAGYSKPWAPLQWEADGQRNREWSGFGPGNGVVVGPGKTRVSIHMPRWASRITMEITSVRVERLQEISIEDAKAEGAWGPDDSIVQKVADYFGTDIFSANPRKAFQMLWESINGPDSWAANPWVWAIEFRRVP